MARKSTAGKSTPGRRAQGPARAGKVTVFMSWSGDRSRRLAEALRKWIELVLHDVDPWVSSQDIQAGSRWERELDGALASRSIGILCLTVENLTAPWIMFEA